LLKRIAELGDAAPARVASVQFNNGTYYYLKRLANGTSRSSTCVSASRAAANPRRYGNREIDRWRTLASTTSHLRSNRYVAPEFLQAARRKACCM
jgi:hypothetical protein